MSFAESLFCYDLDCVAVDSETEKPLFGFQAREDDAVQKDGSFVSGGIASYGLSYRVATADARIASLEPLKTLIFVEGIKYRLQARRAAKYKCVPIGKDVFKEYILVLE